MFLFDFMETHLSVIIFASKSQENLIERDRLKLSLLKVVEIDEMFAFLFVLTKGDC